MDKINDSVNRTDRLNLKSNYLKSTRKEKYSLQPSASLTVESAFVFPFFFLAIVILVLFLDLYRIQSVIQASLSQSSRSRSKVVMALRPNRGESLPHHRYHRKSCPLWRAALPSAP